MATQICTAQEAVSLIFDGARVCSQGMWGNNCAEELFVALEERFLQEGKPTGLKWLHSSGHGNRDTMGLNHVAHEGLLAEIIGGHFGPLAKVQDMIVANQIQAYNLPQGVISHMFRNITGNRPTISRIGLKTFVDPRLEGGKLNACSTKDIVSVLELDGIEYLKYKHPTHLDFAFLRATYADENGNISMEEEPCYLESLQVAQAVSNSGGKVFVQVKQVVQAGTLDARLVHIPGTLVDYVVPVTDMKNHAMTYENPHQPAYSGGVRQVNRGGVIQTPPMDAKRIISRRCALELKPNTVVNLGVGVPEFVGVVAEEENLRSSIVLSIESGPVGGVPASGRNFGVSLNPDAILDQSTQFDTYDGGGLDQAFLGLAETDRYGNVNVSKFGPKVAGAGGFINITQATRTVIFCGTMTAGGLKVAVEDGKLSILQEGKVKKLVDHVQQITFSGELATETNQTVLYVTERAVFKLINGEMTLIEIAPGMDLERDILQQMDFVPVISPQLKTMEGYIFRDEPMGLTQ